MKTLIIASALSVFLFTSCQKAGQEELINEPAAVTTAAPATSLSSGWIPVTFISGGTTSKGLSIAEASVSTEAVNDEILADGIVLVFSRNDNGVKMLPYQDSSIDWSYTVSNSQVAISAISSKAVTDASIQYVVLPASKIGELEKTGYSRSDLLNLPYEKAQGLLGLQ